MKLWNCRFSVIKRGAASIGAGLVVKPVRAAAGDYIAI
jgi:hypothetical protein